MKKIFLRFFIALILIYFLLLIPDSTLEIKADLSSEPFYWNQDAYWDELKSIFEEAALLNDSDIEIITKRNINNLNYILDNIDLINLKPEDTLFKTLENKFFKTASLIAYKSDRFNDFMAVYNRMRTLIKKQSQNWDMNSIPARNSIYRLLYGGRTAIEEIMIQQPDNFFPALFKSPYVASQTPSAEIMGLEIHSGDILVSRGGAPTSALISRGSDYPGNFSHVALVHVDEKTSEVSIIEAHIEIGVAIANVEKYLNDKKLRIMILRLRDNLPLIQSHPLLPHLAAQSSLKRAANEHIAYDFEMNYKNDEKLFCSEVASSAYNKFGIKLWMGISNISTIGVKSWLAAFGVRQFETQEPSDLEYDPQLQVVAEWRDLETLQQDRLDNAVIDVMIEGAEKGDRLEYDWYMLPIGRALKGYSWIKNQFGGVGPIPEGMTAASALCNESFSKRHGKIKSLLKIYVEQFTKDNGYQPPYWELIKLARKAILEIR